MHFVSWFKFSKYGKPSHQRTHMFMTEDIARDAFIAGLQHAAEIADKDKQCKETDDFWRGVKAYQKYIMQQISMMREVELTDTVKEPIMCDGINLRCAICGEDLTGKVRIQNDKQGYTKCLKHGLGVSYAAEVVK